MRFLNVFPLVFCSLALAQDSDGFIAAILYGRDGYEFDILRDRCVNLKRTQPIFHELEVGNGNVCELFSELNCAGSLVQYSSGTFDIEQVQFKSIYCE